MITYIIFIFMGFYLLIKGADFLVDGASNVAKKFHIPPIIIGLTIVAIGTSMPELMVSSTAAIKGYWKQYCKFISYFRCMFNY